MVTERDALKAENDRLQRIVDSVRSKTALDIVAEKMAAQDARQTAEAERDAAIRELTIWREGLGAEHCAAHDRYEPLCVSCRWRSAAADRATLLEAIEAMERATGSGLLMAAEVVDVRVALYDTAKKIRERTTDA